MMRRKQFKSVCYLVTGFSDSPGGHYHSTKHTASFINDEIADAVVIEFRYKEFDFDWGSIESKTVKATMNVFAVMAELPRIYVYLKRKGIRIIHAYDVHSYFIARILNFRSEFKLCLTLCGGANPQYFPKVSNLIVFSEENRDFLLKRRIENLMLIRNRVYVPLIRNTADSVRKRNTADSTAQIVRVGRIHNYYRRSILSLLSFSKSLSEYCVKNDLWFIGKSSSEELAELIRKSGAHMASDSCASANASGHFKNADVVAATGRSLMEAAYFGKLLMCFTSEDEMPVLITENNLNDFKRFNFSERTIVEDTNSGDSLLIVTGILKNSDERRKYESFSKTIFENDFNIASAKLNFEEFYKNLVSHQSDMSDLFKNGMLYLRFAIKMIFG